MMLDTAIDSGDIAKAGEYLDRLGPDSDRRAPAELRLPKRSVAVYSARRPSRRTGRARRNSTSSSMVPRRPSSRASTGCERRSTPAGRSSIPSFSVLALSQILIDAGRAEEAVGWLNDPKIGPLSLVAAKAPVVAGRADFQIDTYKAALRAYVGAQQLDEAEKTMNLLEAAASGDGGGDGARRLTQIYIALGRQLEDLLVRLRNEGKNEQVQKVSQGFELFLDRIASREEGNSFNSLNWVAETLFSLGAGLDPGDGAAPQEARDIHRYRRTDLKSRLSRCPRGGRPRQGVRLAACLCDGQAQGVARLAGALGAGDARRRRWKRADLRIGPADETRVHRARSRRAVDGRYRLG